MKLCKYCGGARYENEILHSITRNTMFVLQKLAIPVLLLSAVVVGMSPGEICVRVCEEALFHCIQVHKCRSHGFPLPIPEKCLQKRVLCIAWCERRYLT